MTRSTGLLSTKPRIALAAATLLLGTTAAKAEGDDRALLPGIDCTFFQSQAFNQPGDHYTQQMAQMCALLSRYKRAVIENNRAKFIADRGDESGSTHRPVPKARVAEVPTSSDSGKYLIAREIGLIDALAALTPEEAE